VLVFRASHVLKNRINRSMTKAQAAAAPSAAPAATATAPAAQKAPIALKVPAAKV
jgi:hypothetical protein